MQKAGRFLSTATLLAALFQPSVALQLNITALGAANNASTLECWQIDTPFTISTQQGTSGSAQLQLGNLSTVSYSVLPAQFDAGAHNAPANQSVPPFLTLSTCFVPVSALRYFALLQDATPVPDFRDQIYLAQSPRSPMVLIRGHAFPFPCFVLLWRARRQTKVLTNMHIRWVVFLSGLAHITLPEDNTTSAYVSGGQFGLIFASDTANVSSTGHSTSYPGITETVALQIPTLDGEIPSHSILHTGPCIANDTLGLLALGSGSS